MLVGGDTSARLSVTRVYSALEARFHEIWRFLTVGVASTAIEFALFNAMVFVLAFGPVTAKVLATGAAMTNAYLGNRHWSFRHRPRAQVGSQALLFVAVNLVGIAMGAAFIAGARHFFEAESFIALNLVNVAAVLFVMVFRFWVYHRWVFPHDGQVLTARAATRVRVPAAPAPAPREEAVPVLVGSSR